MRKIKIFSFFSGIGFLDLGFEDEAFEISLVNEYHKPFLDAYRFSRSKLALSDPEYGYANFSVEDFLLGNQFQKLKRAVKEAQKDAVVGFIGGPPCPDFSVGGKNRGHEGDNGRLSRVYTELINAVKPDFFLFENVKGLWRTKKHRNFFDSLKRDLQAHRYATTERLINSIEYNAPQDRDRIILMGFQKSFLKDIGKKVNGHGELPIGLFPWEKTITQSRDAVFSIKWPEFDKFEPDSKKSRPAGIPENLTVEHWFRKNKVESHPNAQDFFKPRAALKKFEIIAEGDDSKKSFKRLHRWRYSPTACYGNNEVHLHPYKARRITVAEALAIQSLPQKYQLPEQMTLTDKFKSVGNGVPYLAARGLAKSIKEFVNHE